MEETFKQMKIKQKKLETEKNTLRFNLQTNENYIEIKKKRF
jgi:hypothetical protein